MANDIRLELSVVEQRVCDVVSEQLGIPRDEVLPSSRLIEDLRCDSLDLVELIMELEDEFHVTIPNKPTNPVGKSVFIRQPFRLSDLAEIVYLQQGSGKPERKGWRRTKVPDAGCATIPFSQLSGRWQIDSSHQTLSLFEPLGSEDGVRQFRRRSDGMRCLLLPSAQTKIGADCSDAQPDEQPAHIIHLDSFVIDAEPVATTAYCRFLNSVDATDANLFDWFQLEANDDRIAQMPIVLSKDGWRPVIGAETLPMVLVSWFGANAYSLWANASQWNRYDSQDSFLPTEAQWEYAAQGAFHEPSSIQVEDATLVFGQHERGAHYEANTMPMAPVHTAIGLSSFGLHHMAGNVWQWCRDWFADDFYQRPESRGTNPLNAVETGVRSERGGSWVGPIELCRTTYRRGRVPSARGRCLGFRCISPVELLPE
ncbi:MAG: SUMF1/EgtB/PvdO family nonheme iron enzyme [Planctomycetaceae bacterium]|nr:SUMF1/EgtB/PvdO family nonheme iron enzyme [Planctomycetaceae bacterium]